MKTYILRGIDSFKNIKKVLDTSFTTFFGRVNIFIKLNY
jgi:hypothetical protein